MVKISTTISGFQAADSQLLAIPLEMNKQARTALRQMGNVVNKTAKRLVPPPGYPGDKPEFKPLRETLGVEVKEGRQLYAIVGPKRPAGAHGHLVEFSHQHYSHGEPTGVMTEPTPFMGPAAKITRVEQDRLARAAIIKMDKTIDGRHRG